MTLATRTWRKQQGTLKPRGESKEERLRRHEAKQKENAQTGWTPGVNGYFDNQPQENTEAGGGRELLDDLMDELDSGLIEVAEFTARRKAGPPQQGNVVQGVEGNAATEGAEKAQSTAADGQQPQPE